ncbi:MAG TPA: hypothetical protein QF572_19675 [Vicinamibacterales bacterium]|jgi:hypothetical protein|nr:hypothetical protein [Vicinamibacterales bacterium]|tara:strand:- start:172 stop:384 length:213 start_codon:yes stop_codon:yes gene_type:complete
MRLTSFHILFVGLSVVLGFAFGAWAFAVYWSPAGSVGDLGTGIASVLAAWALAMYLVSFVRKVRQIGHPM